MNHTTRWRHFWCLLNNHIPSTLFSGREKLLLAENTQLSSLLAARMDHRAHFWMTDMEEFLECPFQNKAGKPHWGINPVHTMLSLSFHLELGCEVWSCSRYLATRRRGVRVESLPAKAPGVER